MCENLVEIREKSQLSVILFRFSEMLSRHTISFRFFFLFLLPPVRWFARLHLTVSFCVVQISTILCVGVNFKMFCFFFDSRVMRFISLFFASSCLGCARFSIVEYFMLLCARDELVFEAFDIIIYVKRAYAHFYQLTWSQYFPSFSFFGILTFFKKKKNAGKTKSSSISLFELLIKLNALKFRYCY